MFKISLFVEQVYCFRFARAVKSCVVHCRFARAV